MDEDTWNRGKLQEALPLLVVLQVLNIEIFDEDKDCPIWTPDQHDHFTCKSTWKTLRKTKVVT